MSNGDGKLREWIDYLHAAAAVPKSAPDYADAQAAVQEAKLRIQSLMRTANAQDRNEAAQALGANAAGIRAAGVAKGVGEAVGSTLGMAGVIGELPPAATQFLSSLGGEVGGRLGLAAKGTTPADYEASAEANPWASFQGEMAPVVAGSVLSLLPGSVRGTANVSRRIARSSPEPEFTLLPAETKPPVSMTPTLTPRMRPPPDPLNVPTFQRRGLLDAPREVIPRAGKPGHPIWYGEGTPTRSPEVRGGEPLLPSKHDITPTAIPSGPAKILKRQSFAKLNAAYRNPDTPPAVKNLILAEFQRRGIVVSP